MFRYGVVYALLGIVLLGAPALAGESGNWTGKAVLVDTDFKGLAVPEKEGHMLMMGENLGTVFNENGGAFLNEAEYRVQWVIDTGGMFKGGYKTFATADGKAFATFTITEFLKDGLRGNWEFTGGEGKYAGLTGGGKFALTNVSDSVPIDVLKGKYKLPRLHIR